MAVVVVVVMKMAQQSKTNNANNSSTSASTMTHHHHTNINISFGNHHHSNNTTTSTSQQQHQQQQPQQQVNKAMFHDFLTLGMKPSSDSVAPPGFPLKNAADASPSASASLGGASSGGGGGAAVGGGGRAPLSSTSDLASDRQAGNHLEGIPFYGPRSDISVPDISSRLVGSKRSNSDSAFTGPVRDGIPQRGHESLESLHLMKMLKNGGGGERLRRSNDDEVLYGMQPMRPTSASLILQPSAGNRPDSSVSRWDRSIPVGTVIQYPPRSGQFVPVMHQVPTNRFRDINGGPSIISQSAADEGSRTGIKAPGILSSMNAGGGTSEKNSSGALPSGSKPKSGSHSLEPESSTPSSRQGLASSSRQMTIFYGGQAHVFDDVHPNKADVIMALAGSNGGSWSTSYSPKPTAKPENQGHLPCGESEGVVAAANAAFQREFRGRVVSTNTVQGLPHGAHHGSIIAAKDTTSKVAPVARTGNEEK